MPLFRHLLMLLAMLSVVVLPAYADVSSQSGAAEHPTHAQNASAWAQCVHAAAAPEMQGLIQGAVKAARDTHCSPVHGDDCCCMTCAPSFTSPLSVGLQISRLSRAAVLPVPRADFRREEALLRLTFRPPIFG